MAFANQIYSNSTALSVVFPVIFHIMIIAPSCVFLFINVTMLYTLRSKPVFRDNCRFIFLSNLVVADTLHLLLSVVLFLLASRATLTYPVCAVLCLSGYFTTVVSPLTLVIMSLERYIAVCYPLRHASVTTATNTRVALTVVWGISMLNVIIRVMLLLRFPFRSLKMKDYCSDSALLFDDASKQYEKGFTAFVFVLAFVAVISSYVGVTTAAKSASANKGLAQKTRNTLSLHVMQLALTLLSTFFNPMTIAVSKVSTRLVTVQFQVVGSVCFYLLPRFISVVIYGLRDKSIRPVFMYYLCCQMKVSVVPVKAAFISQ